MADPSSSVADQIRKPALVVLGVLLAVAAVGMAVLSSDAPPVRRVRR